jgi:hypothetical protein
MWEGVPLADGGSRDCTSGMDQGLELISVTRVKQYDGCGIEARYAAEELAALRPYREPMRPELFH